MKSNFITDKFTAFVYFGQSLSLGLFLCYIFSSICLKKFSISFYFLELLYFQILWKIPGDQPFMNNLTHIGVVVSLLNGT